MSLVEAPSPDIPNTVNINQVQGNLNQYNAEHLVHVHTHGENGISLLQRNISRDAFHNSEQRYPPPQCHPDTRVAVQTEIHTWAMDLTAPSVVSGQLPRCRFLLCTRAVRQFRDKIFSTIAYQLALHFPALRRTFGLAVEGDPAICDKALEDQMYALIINPLACVDPSDSGPHLVVIDGLDECDDKQRQKRIITIITQAAVRYNIPLKFLICSRPEPHIRDTFNSLPQDVTFGRLVLDETFNPGRDILNYLRHHLSEIRIRRLPNQDDSWPERHLDQLVQCASGQFIYAATVVKFVGDEFCHPVLQLRAVLHLSTARPGLSPFTDLDSLYTHILSANPDVPLVMRILGAFFMIPDGDETCSVRFLEGILALESSTVRPALRGLHSLLLIPDADDEQIRVHHASFRDFLSDPARAGKFHLAASVHHADMGKRCLCILKDHLQNPEQYPQFISRYVTNNWMRHYIPGTEHDQMLQD
ncbi:hypothetical protein C8R46DRAFT_1344585 [Mycena filopes]|nr:hypothetical protein C8R46DRAFT_1344585 [Mycena filopes]